MRSKEIAGHGGCHQIGLLPEPVRDANGYRRHGIRHLVRLLRIGRLSALGLALGEIAPLLDDGAEPGRNFSS